MRYEGAIFRPPSEAGSLLIQATIGCPHNRCTFCGLYKKKKFRIRPVAEIKEDLWMARDTYGNGIRTIFFPDGNSIVLKTAELIEIFEFAQQLFPHLERITIYGSARFLLRKSLDDLKALRQAGLGRIHSGMESGDDEVLRRIQKGATADQIIEAGCRVKEAGIELSEYLLIGIGGRELSQQHALGSARVLNAIDPDFIRVRTYTPVPKTPLGQEYLAGSFQLPSPHEAIKELRLILENLKTTGLFLSDHISNYANINGKLPEDKEKMLQILDYALTIDESKFPSQDYRYM
ncbi:MAG: radical SAM protein [Bacillota bacterium]|jgi:radical SAM superfamily enzyme YgiQ (UPF0313 family)